MNQRGFRGIEEVGMVMRALPILLLLMPAMAYGQGTPGAPPPDDAPASLATKDDSSTKPGLLFGSSIRRDQFRPLTGSERWGFYFRQTYLSPGTVFRAMVPAARAQMNDEPPEWGQGMNGYSKRVADRFGRLVIQDSLAAGSAAALGYDVRYIRCDCKGFFPRFGHAVVWNFLTLDRNGKTVFNSPRVGAAFASEFIGNTWMPADYRTTTGIVGGVGLQLAVGSLFNSIREFMPTKRK